jgi:hypothetical protein
VIAVPPLRVLMASQRIGRPLDLTGDELDHLTRQLTVAVRETAESTTPSASRFHSDGDAARAITAAAALKGGSDQRPACVLLH